MSLLPHSRDEISNRELDGTAFHPSLFAKLKTGDRDVRLNSREVKTLENLFSGYRDADKEKDGHYHKGVNAEEVEQIIQQVKDNPDFGEKKAAHIEEHVRKYLEKRIV
jgi:hypothetical protein